MKTIVESEINFGEYNEDDLFEIEKSRIYSDLGEGIRTVEFILKQGTDNIIFLEAKKSCPNAANKHESQEKEEKFEEYYSSITEKFIDSFQIFLASFLKRYSDDSEIGVNLLSMNDFKDIHLKFILVIKKAEDVAWLAGPMAILKDRLVRYRKIWGIEVAVLNSELAKEYKLIT